MGHFAGVGDTIPENGGDIFSAGEGVSVNGGGVAMLGNGLAGWRGGIAVLGNGVAELCGVISLTRGGGESQSPDAPVDCCFLSHDCVFFGCG